MKNIFLKLAGLSKDGLVSPRITKQAGFSLLEVMIAALILSTGLLGVASLQIIGMKGTQQSSMKNQAMGVVQSITERMRANYQGVVAGDYVLNSSAAYDCTVAVPDPTTCAAGDNACVANRIAGADLHNLVCGYGNPRTGGVKITAAGDISMLVNGSLAIVCAGAGANCAQGDVRITVGWDESKFGEENVTPDSLVLTTRIAAP